MKKYLFDPGKADVPTSVGLLVLRLGFGGMMLFGHGWSKFENFTKAKENFPVPGWFEAFMTSEMSLVLAIATEVIGSALIMLGLLTRPAALSLGFTMLVGAFAIHANDPLFLGAGKAKEPALLYLIPCVAIVLTGAGRFSIDRTIKK